jgi:ferredoxin-NADP reductase
VGDHLDVSSPRGSFVLEPGERPIVLLSAGIGATPVLAMLHALAVARSTRQVMWLHTARDGQHHSFAGEVRRLMSALTNGRSYICYTRPDSTDKTGEGFNATGLFSRSVFDQLVLPRDADAYLCGPTRFMTDMREALTALGVAPERIHIEIFNGGESMTPGVVGATTRPPHPPSDMTSTGPLVSFARSSISAHWDASRYQSILEMAEACDVPVRWACRTGVCHSCESGLISGTVVYDPEPLDKPSDGNLLVCCSQPTGDVVVDL